MNLRSGRTYSSSMKHHPQQHQPSISIILNNKEPVISRPAFPTRNNRIQAPFSLHQQEQYLLQQDPEERIPEQHQLVPQSIVNCINNHLRRFEDVKSKYPRTTKRYWVELARIITELYHHLDYYSDYFYATNSGIKFIKISMNKAIEFGDSLIESLEHLHYRGLDTHALEICIREIYMYLDKMTEHYEITI